MGKTLKESDAFTEVLIIDPITLPLSKIFAYLKISPITITVFAFLLKIAAAYSFLKGELILGAAFAFLGILFDGIDGKVSRLLKKDSNFTGTIDFILDQFAIVAVLGGLLINFRNDFNFVLVIFLWLGLYAVLSALISTKHRLLIQKATTMNKEEHRQVYSEKMKPNSFIGKVVFIYYAAENLFKKWRIVPYPTAVDAEFFMIVLAPLFSNYQLLISSISVLFIVPEILVTLLTVYLLIK